jgi:short-subunit dehydrogenase
MNAIVTGASKGLGKAIANKLASKGYDLFLGSRNEDELLAVTNEIKRSHDVNVFYHVADLSYKEEAREFAKAALAKFGQINVLVNNAGLFLPGNIHEEEDGILEKQIATNLYSAYYLTKALMSALLETPHAHIFNMCSVASKIAYPNGGSYSISKFALLGFSKVLREELKTKNVKVTAILPGAAWSDSWKGADLPYERLMEANDVAEALVSCLNLSPAACVEEIILRPQLGDL